MIAVLRSSLGAPDPAKVAGQAVRAVGRIFGVAAPNGGFGVWWFCPPIPALAGNVCRWVLAFQFNKFDNGSIMEPEFKEYDMVKVVKLLMPNDKRGNMGAEDIRRDPVVGDSGAIVHVHSVIEGLEQAYMVECCDQNGRPYWLADFLESELQMANIFEPPDKIDGAKVIWWAYSSEKPFFIMKYSDGLDYKPIHGFAICRYKDFGEVYRFSCDAEWNTANDAVYNDIEQAISDINNQFQEIHWYKKE